MAVAGRRFSHLVFINFILYTWLTTNFFPWQKLPIQSTKKREMKSLTELLYEVVLQVHVTVAIRRIVQKRTTTCLVVLLYRAQSGSHQHTWPWSILKSLPRRMRRWRVGKDVIRIGRILMTNDEVGIRRKFPRLLLGMIFPSAWTISYIISSPHNFTNAEIWQSHHSSRSSVIY